MFSQRYRIAQSLFSRTILSNYTINTAKATSRGEVEQILIDFSKEDANLRVAYLNEDQFGFYLAGLLEGDGSISLPSLGNTILNRVLNPRIVFTTHKNNLGLYVNIQSKLGGVGRFQFGQNTVRYIIGDIKSIQLFINLIHGKLRTSKNIRFNDLIKFINAKYSLDIPESTLDTSDLSDNSWLAGFTEADGHFGVKIVESKPKSDTRKRSVFTSLGAGLAFVILLIWGINDFLVEYSELALLPLTGGGLKTSTPPRRGVWIGTKNYWFSGMRN